MPPTVCPCCSCPDAFEASRVTVEWFVDGTATYDTNFAGSILVCADCGFTRHHMEKPREWATAAFAKPVRAAGSPYR